MLLSKPHPNRLTALDGLRGISSLLVLATHLKLDIPLLTDQITFVPLRLIVRTIMNTGNISVGFFFILCGFLMAYLYEDPPSYVPFLQKRYLRIFTVFIVAVVISFRVMYLGATSITLLLLTLIAVPMLFRITYTILLKVLKSKFVISFLIFILTSQVIIAFINYFIVFRIGAHEFYSLPKTLYTSFIFATNYTLTFIFGDYIPMLDGGYWSLVSEVMFYLMYPLIAWLLIKPMQRLSRYYWILWYFASMITCFGLALLFENFLAFDTAHIHFAHFFTVGMIIALAYKDNSKTFQKIILYFETSVGQVTSVFLYIIPVASAFWLGYIANPYTKYLVAYGLAPFMGIAVIALIAQKNILSRFLRTPIFLFLGAISFPLYVIHSPVVHVLWQIMRIERDPTRWIQYLVFASALSLGAAYYLHIVIERFYFIVTKQMKGKSLVNNNISVLKSSLRSAVLRQAPRDDRDRQDDTAEKQSHRMSGKKLVLSSFLLCVMLVFVAFQQDFSILSMVHNHDKQSLIIKGSNDAQYSLLENNKIQGKFLANEDNLGIVTMKIQHIGPINQDRGIQEKKDANILIFRMREVGNKTLYHESRHVAWQISSEKSYPFGFPQIADSRNKWFEFELESIGASAQDYVVLSDSFKDFQSVYKLPKKTIIKEPALLLPILLNKVYGAFSQREAQIVFVVYLFTLCFVWFVQYKAKRILPDGRITR